MRTFLTAQWRWLAMLNYAADPDILAPLVPTGTELDLWRGTAYVSVVGFRFLETRVLGVPVPLHRDFDEVNLRFYVRRIGDDGAWRRGVVFVREVVPRSAIALIARTLYNEPYLALPMKHDVRPPKGRGAGKVEYRWRHRGRWNAITATIEGDAAPTGIHSFEEFITEHYWGYTRQRDGGTIEYRVEHPRWPAWRAVSASLDCDVRAMYGDVFTESLGAAPRSAFVAVGSEVTVYRGVRLPSR
ncbi:MAG: DUF2071 domain-containing protein [Gemmatimonadota bacterium]|nr:DUF2071 domain-containing protein [Gemmatimonadota bacterium]